METKLSHYTSAPSQTIIHQFLRRRICASWISLLLLALPAAVQAQFIFVTNVDGTLWVTGYTGSGGDVTVPDATNGMLITRIASFSQSRSVTNVTMGTNVLGIMHNAFYYCLNLASVTIGNNVKYIDQYAFNTCTNLRKVTIGNGLTYIGDYAFTGCSSLTGVYFRGAAPSLGLYNFKFDDNVTVYYLPGTTGWDNWVSPPSAMLWQPLMQTADDSFGVQTNQFGFNIAWTSGMLVAVDACTNLTTPAWFPLQTNTLTADTFYFSDPQWTNYPACLYRLRWPGP